MKKLALAMVVVGSTFLYAERDAHALGAEVGGDIGYGLKPFAAGYDNANPYGFGLGLHGGVEISSFYLGASYRYFFGGSYDTPATNVGGISIPSQHVSISTMQFGGELGYNVTLGPVTLRPYLFGGPTIYSGSIGSTSSSSTHFTFAPAAHLHFKVAGPLFFGADVRYALVVGNSDADFATQLSILGSVGIAL